MTASIRDALAQASITLRAYGAGQHRAPCPKCDHGPRDDALGVTIGDDGPVWHCFRCDWRGSYHVVDGGRTERQGAPTRRRSETQPESLSPKWLKFWDQCGPISESDTAGRYLMNRLCALPTHDMRWHRGVWHRGERREIPAIVALITDIATTEPISLHFTFLARDGSRKAPIERDQLYLLGHRKAGGVVRLHADHEVTQGLIIGEGLETCLSYALEFSPVWACLDASGIAAFPVLAAIEGLTVLVDHDPAGEAAFKQVQERYHAAGRTVLGIKAATPGQDLNDLVRG